MEIIELWLFYVIFWRVISVQLEKGHKFILLQKSFVINDKRVVGEILPIQLKLYLNSEASKVASHAWKKYPLILALAPGISLKICMILEEILNERIH